MKKISYIIVSLSLCLSAQISYGQKASAKIGDKPILIGDQKELKLEFTYPSEYKFTWPKFTDSLSKNVEIVDRSKVDTVITSDKKQFTLSQTLKITSFDSGSWFVPPFAFPYNKPNDTTNYVSYTDSLLFNVITIAVDTTKDFKDIKAPFEQGLTFMEILPYILIALAVCLIAFFIIYYFHLRKKGIPLIRIAGKPTIPPHETALEALEKLRVKKLWQAGKVKEYHTELTEILRIYLLQQFNVEAMEMTSDEILSAIKYKDIEDDIIGKLRQILLLADLVKFAKENPLPQDHDLSLNYAFEFVKATIPVIINEEDNHSNNNEIVIKE